MNRPDTDLDNLLNNADSQLLTGRAQPHGPDIRRLVAQRRDSRRKKRLVLVGAMAGMVIIGAILINRNPDTPSNLTDRVAEGTLTEQPDTELLAVVEALREEQREIDRQLALLNAKHRLNQIQRSIRRVRENELAPRASHRRNRDAWISLRQVAPDSPTEISFVDRWRLRVVARQFQGTTAGSVANSILLHQPTSIPLREESDGL